MKTRLHPYLVPRGTSRKDSGNDHYHGGHLNLFGIDLEIAWSRKEESWMISCPHIIDNEELSSALEKLTNALSPEDMAVVFGDEKEVFLKDIAGKEAFFWDSTGTRWMVGHRSGQLPGENICMKIIALSDLPSGEVKLFDDNCLVYVYPKERS